MHKNVYVVLLLLSLWVHLAWFANAGVISDLVAQLMALGLVVFLGWLEGVRPILKGKRPHDQNSN